MPVWLIILLTGFLLSLVMTKFIRAYALQSRNMIDQPNHRSSHTVATPSGGGLAIVCGSIAASGVAISTGMMTAAQAWAIIPPAIIIAAIGFLDDWLDLSRQLRFLVQIAAVAWFLTFLGRPPYTGIALLDSIPLLAYFLCGFAFLWAINLYNFMDGIDGLAAGESAYLMIAVVFYSLLFGMVGSITYLSIAVFGASLGFLVWNWAPAKIFMGDAGSAYLGFMFGAVALSFSTEYQVTVWPFLILFGVFLVDASITLIRRGLTGQRWYEAHRSHAYQQLTSLWGTHWSVTTAIMLINLCWLLPLGMVAFRWNDLAGWITLIALSPLAMIAFLLNAGRQDPTFGK